MADLSPSMIGFAKTQEEVPGTSSGFYEASSPVNWAAFTNGDTAGEDAYVRLNLGGVPAELVQDGDFDGDPADVWDTSLGGIGNPWTIAGGVAGVDNGLAGLLAQYDVVTGDDVYIVTFTVSNYVDGTLTPVLGGTVGAAETGDGTKVQYLKADPNAPYSDTYVGALMFLSSSGATFDLDDVSVVRFGARPVTGFYDFVVPAGTSKIVKDRWVKDATVWLPAGADAGAFNARGLWTPKWLDQQG